MARKRVAAVAFFTLAVDEDDLEAAIDDLEESLGDFADQFGSEGWRSRWTLNFEEVEIEQD